MHLFTLPKLLATICALSGLASAHLQPPPDAQRTSNITLSEAVTTFPRSIPRVPFPSHTSSHYRHNDDGDLSPSPQTTFVTATASPVSLAPATTSYTTSLVTVTLLPPNRSDHAFARPPSPVLGRKGRS